jgi:enoyl-CoA hydratase/carnithine racemase
MDWSISINMIIVGGIIAVVEWQKDGTVAIMIMNNGENRQDPDWTEAMLTVFSEIIADQEIKALVLTSSDPKFFSLGVNTEWIFKAAQDNDYPGISKWFYRNHEVFTSLMMAPFPTIAAINGHAFGNGLMLAGACDFRFIESRQRVLVFSGNQSGHPTGTFHAGMDEAHHALSPLPAHAAHRRQTGSRRTGEV